MVFLVRGSAHDAIRRQTRHLHDALGSRLVLSKLVSRMGYIDFLLFSWACAPIEQALEDAGIGKVFLDWDQRRRRISLATDLEALGVRLPFYGALTIDSDVGSMLGWSYVLEGSRLGARVILETVMTSPEATIRRTTSFLRHGEGKQLWESFKVELGKMDRDPPAIARACTSANAAFQYFGTFRRTGHGAHVQI
jgi:heme oxygenase